MRGRLTGERIDKEIVLAGTARSIAETLRMAANRPPDIVLTGWRLRDGTGADLTRRLLATLPRTAVIVLAPMLSHRTFIEIANSGAWTILDSRISISQMRIVLRTVIEERLLWSGSDHLAGAPRVEGRPRPTPSEVN